MQAESPVPVRGRRRADAPGSLGQRLAVTGNVTLAVALAAVVLTLFLSPRDSEFVATPFLGFVLSMLALASGVLLARRWPGPRLLTRRQTWRVAAALSVFSWLVAVFSEFRYGWDPRAVQSATYQLAETGHLDLGLLEYFARYPNNLPLTLLETPLTWVARLLGVPFFQVVAVWNAVLFFGVLILTARTLERLDRRTWVVPAFALLTLLLGLSTHMAMPYTDLPGCFLAALLIHLGVRARGAGERLYPLLCGIALVVGLTYLLKPYVLVIPIAGVVTFVLGGGMMGLRRRWGGRGLAVRILALPLIAFAASSIEKDLAYRNAHVTPEILAEHNAPFPVLHWVAMGLHDNGSELKTRTYGSFDMNIMRRDVQIKDPAHRDEVIREGIADDLSRQGLGGTLAFMGKKIAWVLGDATFYAQKDGSDGRAHAERPGPVAAFTLRDGGLYHLKAGLVQAVWAATLLALAAGLVRARRDVTVGWLSLALLGFIVYEAVFEGRPRYVVAVLPVFIVLLGLTAPSWPGARGASTRRQPVHRAGRRRRDVASA